MLENTKLRMSKNDYKKFIQHGTILTQKANF